MPKPSVFGTLLGVQVQRNVVRFGKELFRGVLFGQGAVADALPEVWERAELRQMHTAPTTEALAAIDGIVSKLDATYPGYFDRFASDMQSGDHVQIRSTLQDALTKVMSVSNAPHSAKPMCFAGPIAVALAFVYLAVVAVQYAWVDGPHHVDPVTPPSGGESGGGGVCEGATCGGPDPGGEEMRKVAPSASAPSKLREAAPTDDDPFAGLGQDELIELIATRFALAH